MKSRLAARSAATIGALVTFGFMLYAGSPSDPSWWKEMPIFGVWCLLPYLVVLLLSWRWQAFAAPQLLLAIAAAVITLPLPFVVYDTFIAHQSSTSGLIFLFLPAYQLMVVVPLSLAAWWTARKATQA